MQRRPATFATCALAAAALLAACSSTPQVRFHTLVPADTPASASALPAVDKVAVVLEPIRLPAQVDQPQWFVRLADGTVALLEQDRWASPLRDELRQALLERLTVRWGASTLRPPAGAVPAVRVAIDVRRFDGVVGRESRIEGSWTLAAGETGGRASTCDWSLREPAEAGTIALAAAHRRAVERLGDAIGASLRQVARGQPATCPARDDMP